MESQSYGASPAIWDRTVLHMTQCAKIIVVFVANVGKVFVKRFFNIFSTFITFIFLSEPLLHLCG